MVVITWTEGADTLTGGFGDDVIRGRGGDDITRDYDGFADIEGGDGDDYGRPMPWSLPFAVAELSADPVRDWAL